MTGSPAVAGPILSVEATAEIGSRAAVVMTTSLATRGEIFSALAQVVHYPHVMQNQNQQQQPLGQDGEIVNGGGSVSEEPSSGDL